MDLDGFGWIWGLSLQVNIGNINGNSMATCRECFVPSFASMFRERFASINASIHYLVAHPTCYN